jgi:hypothetical protein
MLNGSSKFRILQQTYGLNVLIGGCLVLLVASIVILASTPPVSRDALTHHLAMPKLYLKQGAIYEIPYAKWSYYPMNLDLLYMIPLYFGNDIIPKFIHFAFALLTGWLIFRYLKKRSELPYAILGVVFFLSIPVIVKLSITVYVDLGLIFFSFAALTYLFKWFETDFKLKSLVASAICCGIALGIKYNALISFFLLTLFIVFVYSRLSPSTHAKQTKALMYGAVFMLIAATVFSPWALRNFKWTNNPLYPLYNSWFNPTKTEFHDITEPRVVPNSTEDADAGIKPSKGRWTHFAIRKIIFNETWWEIALIPVRIFFQGRDGNPKYFDGKLNPLLFFLPFFAFIGIRSNFRQLQIEKKTMLAFAVLFIFLAFVQRDMRIRYIGPAIPPLVVLSIFGLQGIIVVINDRFNGIPKKIYLASVLLLVLFFLGLNLHYILNQYRWVQPVRYLKGELKRDAYIEKYRPEYAVIKYANQHLSADAKILGVFLGNRGYYSDREMRFDYDPFIKNTFKHKYLDEAILANFKKSGITHLLIRLNAFNNWVRNNFDDREKQRLIHFFQNYTVLLFSKNGHGLYNLGSTATLRAP